MNLLPYLWLIPALPFASSVTTLLAARWMDRAPETSFRKKLPGILCTVAVTLSFFLAVLCVAQLANLPDRVFELRGPDWVSSLSAAKISHGLQLRAEWGLLLDPLSAVMILLVSGVGSLVHLYSIGYMHGERDLSRYFGALSFFIAMMQLLVLANNYLLLFAGWEGVGLASYLLIGFFFERPRAAYAASKAFIVNRIGDAAMLIGIIFLFTLTGSLRFLDVSAAVSGFSQTHLTVIALLLLLGAMGKSAQFPLHIWLPDAMEGPTPVSALIHAATMVCAGVYLIARSGFLFQFAPEISLAISILGAVTALFAATIALVENDIKRVLAYSTISQVGFMFLALGTGAYWVAIFHVFTHAFFKALLFLSAGTLIHALHGEQNLKHMGGLRDKLPLTYRTMWIGALALAGIPGLAGFFSKDEILWQVANAPSLSGILLFIGLFTSLLTACYMGRLMYLAFYGEPRKQIVDLHDPSPSMSVPLVVLAAGSILAGWLGVPAIWTAFGKPFHSFERWLEPSSHSNTPHANVSFEWLIILLSAVIAIGGIALARRFYFTHPDQRLALDLRFRPIVSLLRNRWFVDALFEEKFVDRIVLGAARAAAKVDTRLIDGIVNGAGWLATLFSKIFKWLDHHVVDGLVRLTSNGTRWLSFPVRYFQTGMVQTYAFLFVAGVLAAVGYYLTR